MALDLDFHLRKLHEPLHPDPSVHRSNPSTLIQNTTMASPKLLSSGGFSHIINGKAYDAKGAKTLDVINPATEKTIASVPIATREVLDEAVDHAHKAFKSWSKTTWQERAKMVQVRAGPRRPGKSVLR